MWDFWSPFNIPKKTSKKYMLTSLSLLKFLRQDQCWKYHEVSNFQVWIHPVPLSCFNFSDDLGSSFNISSTCGGTQLRNCKCRAIRPTDCNLLCLLFHINHRTNHHELPDAQSTVAIIKQLEVQGNRQTSRWLQWTLIEGWLNYKKTSERIITSLLYIYANWLNCKALLQKHFDAVYIL